MGDAWIDSVRIARDHGELSDILPSGVTLLTAPFALIEAIRMAHVFIGFQDLPEDERPPRSMWRMNEKLVEWFQEVRRRRAREASGDEKPIEDPVKNAAAGSLLVG